MALEVLDYLVTAWEGRRALRVGTTRQLGEATPGVEVEAVVAPPPRRADLLGLVEHDRRQPGVLERQGGGNPARTGPDNHDIVLLIHSFPLAHSISREKLCRDPHAASKSPVASCSKIRGM